MQVFFEIGVIGLDHRQLQLARQAHTRVVSNKRCLNMDQIELLRAQARREFAQCPGFHQAIFGIAWQVARRDANNVCLLGDDTCGVFRCDQDSLDDRRHAGRGERSGSMSTRR